VNVSKDYAKTMCTGCYWIVKKRQVGDNGTRIPYPEAVKNTLSKIMAIYFYHEDAKSRRNTKWIL